MAAPWWLLGLALLPLIRWLHRGGRHRRAVVVPHLALWRGPAVNPAAQGRHTPPDPAWRRRALLAGLLVGALAQPQWPRSDLPVTLWVDDSLSMLTREADGSRLAEGLALARSQLAAAGVTDTDVRTLSKPWQRLGALADSTGDAVIRGLSQGAGPAPQAPPAALLDTGRRHWLLTDGAHPALQQWPAPFGPEHIIQVGAVHRNAGLQRASARQALDPPQRLELMFKVNNGGSMAERRTLVVRGPAGEISRTDLQLEAGASAWVQATMPWAAQVRADLQPADALVEDDRLVLDLAALAPVGVAMDAACPDTLRAVLAAHPALAVLAAGAATARARVACGGADWPPQGPPPLPTLHLVADRNPSQAPGPLQWAASMPASARLAVDPQTLSLTGSLTAGLADQVLLAVAGQPVLVRRAGAINRLDTSVDLTSREAGAGLPLLANLMLEQLLQRRLLGDLAVVDRGADAARVAPQALAASAAGPQIRAAGRRMADSARLLLALAALVLLWELLALGRQAQRQGQA